ncbi:hypothetical protein CesoFtcFv8_000622 [Champsocephalus esox]|uniref:Uncharacterized protein n=1 Tax=Champsocephalus esox TaxID=159716 RepID=A0AAN8D469_9TELE|nr:hypothetical protein CesoFtcFv8_000622 [Champsocephalus esox]
MITELTSVDLGPLLGCLTMGTRRADFGKDRLRGGGAKVERESGGKRGFKRAVYGGVYPYRAHFKDCPTCTNNHGNLWLVINALAGALNHSGRGMARCLTV